MLGARRIGGGSGGGGVREGHGKEIFCEEFCEAQDNDWNTGIVFARAGSRFPVKRVRLSRFYWQEYIPSPTFESDSFFPASITCRRYSRSRSP